MNNRYIQSMWMPFYMDKYEVTNAEYAAFLNAKGKHIENGIVGLTLQMRDALIERVGGRYRILESGVCESCPVIEVKLVWSDGVCSVGR